MGVQVKKRPVPFIYSCFLSIISLFFRNFAAIMMTYAEACIRERQENVTEDFIRGAVWAIMKVYELVPYDRTKSYKERIDMILDLEKTFPDYIAAEKESFEFNRGATH